MGNDLIWKIAVGVFLGMAAWTYRADLGTMALYAVGIFIALAVVFFCYQAIANPIKNRLKEQSIKNLGACPRFCVNGLMAGNCLHLQRKRNDRKQRTHRPPVGGLQKT
ncbi:hypothetical protein [Limnohabitans sp. B9-3]|uniref:hypothetical protein n=1 Tax=Limnohabitans sp. B9-3 TaxID=1100707 RepID=UPI000C1F3F8A|nr:hypothetical protein [Limnohabitans sp. B9-3]PIT71193.1 hypothetical protein B9Z42_16120 [Limnohabitans sp. B9-3]